jgi:hypothetical protein
MIRCRHRFQLSVEIAFKLVAEAVYAIEKELEGIELIEE